MTHPQRSPKTIRITTGLRAVFHPTGCGAPSSTHHPHRRYLAAALLPAALILFLALGAPSALAVGGPPQAFQPEFSNLTATSAHLHASFMPDGLETEYRLEYTTEPGNSGSWAEVPGGSGTVPVTTDTYRRCTANLTGLSPSTTYYVRLFAKSSAGEVTSQVNSFETYGPPAATTFSAHALAPGSETIRILGSATPNGTATDEEQTVAVGGGATSGTFTLSFEGETTAPIPFIPHETVGENSEQDRVRKGLAALPSIGPGNVSVSEDFATSTYTVEFKGALAGKDLPEMSADASGLTLSGTVTVATLQNGAPFDFGYRFQYTTTDFTACGEPANPACQQTAAVDLGDSGGEARIVGVDLPGLQPGETYRYRILANNNTFGNPVLNGSEQALTVPVPGKTEAGEEVAQPDPCPNQATRSGSSAKLPDCRAYEQITPVDKEGAQDIFNFASVTPNTALLGEDGEHVLVKPQLGKWGTDIDAVNSAYFFTRGAGEGWRMTSSTPQPASAHNSYRPTLFSPDLTRIGLKVGWSTGTINASPGLEFKLGPPGGPYTAVTAIPRKQMQGGSDGWVAASPDFSKAILATEDRTLAGPNTGTKEGDDLYEYTAAGLRQLNVTGEATPIGKCGAQMVDARAAIGAGGAGGNAGAGGAPGAGVSADGRRVFFEAVPGNVCSAPRHLYMRTDGAETTDIGPFRFLAGDNAGSDLLLSQGTGGAGGEVFRYDTETPAAPQLLPGAQTGVISQDLSTIYFTSAEQLSADSPPLSSQSEDSGDTPRDLYRYDIGAGALRFIAQIGNNGENGGGAYASPDGRFYYFSSSGVAAVFREVDPGAGDNNPQAYRYDSVEDLLQCISCASPFYPRPQRYATFLPEGVEGTPNSAPAPAIASANGDFVFFDTAAELVPSDVNGEVHPSVKSPYDDHNFYFSVSSDVYEWRRNGVDGCTHIQGCLALITSGRDGLKNILLGTTATGRDVLFATHSQLAATDDDNAGDVYDARIGGGFLPPPPPPVECEGDACHRPAGAPDDPTPASETFHGAGNEHQGPTGKRRKHPRHHGKRHHKHARARHARHTNTIRGGAK